MSNNNNTFTTFILSLLGLFYLVLSLLLKFFFSGALKPEYNLLGLPIKLFNQGNYGTLSAIALAITLIIFILFAYMLSLSRKVSNLGEASFGTYRLAKKLGLTKPQGFFVGAYGKKFNEKNILRIQERSALVLAPPGGGKTAGLIIPAILELGRDSAIVLDIKGEIEEVTKKQRQKGAGQTHTLDFYQENAQAKFNPFAANAIEGFSQTEIMLLVTTIAQTLYPDPADSAESTWITNARSLFSLAANYLIFSQGGTSIYEIYQFVTDRDFRKNISRIQNERISEGKLPASLISEANNFLGMEAKQYSGVSSTMTEKLSSYRIDIVGENTKEMTLPTDLRAGTHTIYLRVKQTEITALAGVLSTVFSYYFILLNKREKNKPDNRLSEEKKQAFLKNQKDNPDRQIWYILDEFAQLNKMDNILEAPATVRSYGLSMIYIVQSLTQLSEKYSDNKMKKFLDILTYIIILGSGGDEDGAKKLSNIVGNKTYQKQSSSKQSGTTGQSVSTSDEGIALITAQSLQNMKPFTGYLLVERNYKNPLPIALRLWFKDKKLRVLKDPL